jgi:hypothetical protein
MNYLRQENVFAIMGAEVGPGWHWLVSVRARTGSLRATARHYDGLLVKLTAPLAPGGGVLGAVLVQV